MKEGKYLRVQKRGMEGEGKGRESEKRQHARGEKGTSLRRVYERKRERSRDKIEWERERTKAETQRGKTNHRVHHRITTLQLAKIDSSPKTNRSMSIQAF